MRIMSLKFTKKSMINEMKTKARDERDNYNPGHKN